MKKWVYVFNELRAVEKAVTLWIDENSRAARADEDPVGRPGLLLPGEGVFVSRAAPGLDPDPQTPAFQAVFGEHFVDLIRGVLADGNHDVTGR